MKLEFFRGGGRLRCGPRRIDGTRLTLAFDIEGLKAVGKRIAERNHEQTKMPNRKGE